ncbi:hypothetical protein [Anaerofustis stercorihominis]|uniref:hypothetical protein n=1 Tax=Anaerofustis stercorihominis TaxID=214853 RepID=UPI002673FCEA|nr:hypothetical protein [Anaerofustis stercorihominis]
MIVKERLKPLLDKIYHIVKNKAMKILESLTGLLIILLITALTLGWFLWLKWLIIGLSIAIIGLVIKKIIL